MGCHMVNDEIWFFVIFHDIPSGIIWRTSLRCFYISHALGTHIKQNVCVRPHLPVWPFQEEDDGYVGTSHLVNYSLKVEN